MHFLAWRTRFGPALLLSIACACGDDAASPRDRNTDSTSTDDDSDESDDSDENDDTDDERVDDAGRARDGGARDAGRMDGGGDATTIDAEIVGTSDGGPLTVPDASARDATTEGIDAAPDSGAADAARSDAAPSAMVPIDPPLADDCITSVSPGDHSFTCQGVTFLVTVDRRCTEFACGLIFDVHGALMSGEIQRTETQLHELAPQEGYLVVHPSAPSGVWDLQNHPPILADFMTRMIRAFHVDEKRVHFTGFSMGSAMTFWFLCNHRDVLASVAPVTGESAEQVTVVGSDAPCIASIDESWQPRVPILFMSGTLDNALLIENARARAEGIAMRLSLSGGDEIEGETNYRRKRWQGTDGMVLDFLEHDYSNFLLAGHCIPGGPAGDIFACDDSGTELHWGKTALRWFIEHPKP